MDHESLEKEDTKKGPKWKRSRYVELYFQQHQPFGTVSKSLSDPQNLLSRNKRRQIFENSDLAFQCDYSLDKNRRWETMNPLSIESFTHSPEYEGVDFYILEEYKARQIDNVNVVHFIRRDNEIVSRKNTGRMTSAASMIFQASGTPNLRSKQWKRKWHREKWANTVIQPRVVYNVRSLHPAKALFYRMFTTGGGHSWRREMNPEKGDHLQLFLYKQAYVCSCVCEYDDEHWIEYLDDQTDFWHLVEDEEASHYLSQTRKGITLGDFIVPKKKRIRKHGSSMTLGNHWEILDETPLQEEEEKREVNGFRLVKARRKDASSHINSIPRQGFIGFFEVAYSGDEASFQREISNLANGVEMVRFLDARRAIGDLSSWVRKPSENVEDPQLLVMLHLSAGLIRFTVNTIYDSDRLWDMLLRYSFRKDTKDCLRLILTHIASIVSGWKEKSRPPRRKESRCTRFPSLFSPATNSSLQATLAIAPKLSEIILALQEHEKLSISELTQVPKTKDLITCSLCEIDLNPPEFFPTINVNLCPNCIRLILYSQITEGKPITIFSDTYSALDLLPFFVQLTEIRAYYQRVASEVLDVGEWIKCPRCDRSLFLPFTSEILAKYDAEVICSECSSHFCALCSSEPHFPMNCDEHFEWSLIFDDYYTMMLKEGPIIWRVSCKCGAFIETQDNQETAQCSECQQAFSPRHTQIQLYRKPTILKDSRLHETPRLYSFDDGEFKVKLLQKKRLAIDGRFAKPAFASRKWRLDWSAQRSFIDGFKGVLSLPHAQMIKETCKLAHRIIENGFGLLYLYKDEDHSREATAINRLKTNLWNLIDSQDRNLFKNLKDALDSTIELFAGFEHRSQ